MSITAKVIADSIGYKGQRITTFSLHYPRFIHSELMTHRLFSRNSSSSRAIPVQKMIDKVKADPVMPIFWGKNQAGMQAREELSDYVLHIPARVGYNFEITIDSERNLAKKEWLLARDSAVFHVEALLKLGLHKQIANRLLEPWMYQDTVLTSTYWGNFYTLRNHEDAQPELKVLAEEMLKAHNESVPVILNPGEWHLPFVHDFEKKVLTPEQSLVSSVARCARVSYMNHEGALTTYQEDKKTFDRLLAGNPKHASPSEHQAKVPVDADLQDGYVYPHLLGNFQNWVQYRKCIKGENSPIYEKLLPK